MFQNAAKRATGHHIEQDAVAPDGQHPAILGVTFEHDVEEGFDILVERQPVNRNDEVFRLQTKRPCAGNRAQFFHHEIGSCRVLASCGGTRIRCHGSILLVRARCLAAILPALAGDGIDIVSNGGGGHCGRHRFVGVCQFLFCHEPASLSRGSLCGHQG